MPKLRFINGLTPEEYMARQRAAEARVRKKNRREHIIYAVVALVLLILAGTPMQYLFAGITIVGGWVTLWFSQKTPFGMDGGMSRTRGLPPFLGLILLLCPLITAGTLVAFFYRLATGT